MKTFVRLFKSEFASKVLSGEKTQTVRPVPKRMPKPGDRISCRAWTGAPYRSKQRILREETITKIDLIYIWVTGGIQLNGSFLTDLQEWDFARADGFNTPKDLCEWFAFTHGLPFAGIVMYWEK